MRLFSLVERNPDPIVELGAIEDGERYVVYRAPDDLTVRRHAARTGLRQVEVHPLPGVEPIDVDLHICRFGADRKCRVCYAVDPVPEKTGGWYDQCYS